MSIRFYNRYSGAIEDEAIYGEAWIRRAYENPVGRWVVFALVKRALFSRWYGWRMDRPSSRQRVQPFVERYNLRLAEFAERLNAFRSFNEFFYRRLKPEARPIDADSRSVVFPADGRHLGFENYSKIDGIFAKGEVFSLAELLQDEALAERFHQGVLVISRLCPVDYHRFHFPFGGVPGPARLIPGALYSVNPIALRQDIRILVRNRRWVTNMESPGLGSWLMVEVGATNVGSSVSTFRPGQAVRKGEEKGYFRFGGSLTMCLFAKGTVRLESDLLEWSPRGMEVFARVGDRLGMLSSVS